eukprot:733002-Rhodomonas_salina.1
MRWTERGTEPAGGATSGRGFLSKACPGRNTFGGDPFWCLRGRDLGVSGPGWSRTVGLSKFAVLERRDQSGWGNGTGGREYRRKLQVWDLTSLAEGYKSISGYLGDGEGWSGPIRAPALAEC